jgi:hypothetical protein
MTTATIDAVQVQAAHDKAMAAARAAAQAFSNKHFNGRDGGACGFAWVNVYKVRSNSKLGKALSAVGFRKSYTGGLQLWNSVVAWSISGRSRARGHSLRNHAQTRAGH